MKKSSFFKRMNITVWALLSLLLLGATVTMPDPTRPPDFVLTPKTVSTSNQPLTLMAIFIYPNYRFAIINGAVVKIGDRLGEFTITSINPYTVELLGPQNDKQVLQLLAPVKQSR